MRLMNTAKKQKIRKMSILLRYDNLGSAAFVDDTNVVMVSTVVIPTNKQTSQYDDVTRHPI